MQIPALIEPIAGNGYLAKTGEPLALRAEGATPDDALRNLQEMVRARLANGAQIAPVEVANAANPWLAMAGMHDPTDPEVIAWKHEMAKYRAEVDAEPDDE